MSAITSKSLMNVLNIHVKELVNNQIIQSMTVIDWGKAMARANEYIQKNLLVHCGIDAYDPGVDENCPKINVDNNSPGFDLVIKNNKGKLKRVQSKLRQVAGNTDFSRQTHFETTRRNSKKNKDTEASETGHVAYSIDEFDYVMVTLVNVNNGLERRNDVNLWSFSIIPIKELVNGDKSCCMTKIPSKILKKYEYKIDPLNPPNFD